MKVQILLFTDFKRNIIDANFFIRSVGPYRLATELRNNQFTVQVVDHFLWYTNDQITAIIEKFVDEKTLIIGFSSTFCNFPDDKLKYVQTISKKISPNVKLVFGGSQADTLENNHIDIFIKGYADTTIISLANELLKQQNIKYSKVMARNGKLQNVIDWDTKAESFDFQSSSTIFSDTDFIQPGEVLPIEISRGCIFKCKFCAFPLNGRKKNTYMKHSTVLYNELMFNYKKYKTTHYIFLDDTHNESVEKLESLYNNVFSKLPFQIQYWTFLRHDLIYHYREMADILLKSGLRTACFGLETLGADAAKIIGKGLNPNKAIELLYWVKEKWGNKIGTASGFILGLPGDTPKTLSEWTPKLCKKDFPLDTIFLNALGISSLQKTWGSEFEMNPQKYGYFFPTNDPHFWQNQYFNKNIMTELKENLVPIVRNRSIIAGTPMPWGLKNHGFDFEKSRVLPSDSLPASLINNYRQQLVDKFFLQLMSI